MRTLNLKNSEVAPLPALYSYSSPGCRTSKCAIKDRNLNNEEALQLVKEFQCKVALRDNINFYLEVTDSPSVDGLFENLRQVFFIRRGWSTDVGQSSIVAYKIKKNRLRNSESHYCK